MLSPLFVAFTTLQIGAQSLIVEDTPRPAHSEAEGAVRPQGLTELKDSIRAQLQEQNEGGSEVYRFPGGLLKPGTKYQLERNTAAPGFLMVTPQSSSSSATGGAQTVVLPAFAQQGGIEKTPSWVNMLLERIDQLEGRLKKLESRR
ncbi:MAG: hypothetical protein EON54_10780 [Alcaligenaceae bacterium]|nr:MAG: hypothetical protein EON54_10780 [Alcaligenaceae bacterium]